MADGSVGGRVASDDAMSQQRSDHFVPVRYSSSHFKVERPPPPAPPPLSMIGTSKMPTLVLGTVFSFAVGTDLVQVAGIAAVCRRWRTATFVLWQQVTVFPQLSGDISNNQTRLWAYMAKFFTSTSRGQHVKSFQLVDRPSRVEFFASPLPVNLRLWDVIFLTRQLTFLTDLDLRGAQSMDFSAGEPFLLAVTQSLPLLETLKVDRSCLTLNGGAHIWSDLLQSLPRLRSLTIGDKYNKYMSCQDLELGEHANQLIEHLEALKIYAPLAPSALTKLFSLHAPKLRVLAVNCVQGSCDVGVEPQVASRMPELRKFVATNAVTFAFLFRVLFAVQHPHLQVLRLGGSLKGSAVRMEKSLIGSVLAKPDTEQADGGGKKKGDKPDKGAKDKKGAKGADANLGDWLTPHGFTPLNLHSLPEGQAAIVELQDPRVPVPVKKAPARKKKDEKVVCRPLFPFEMGVDPEVFGQAISSATDLALTNLSIDRVDEALPLANLTALSLSHNLLRDAASLLTILAAQSQGLTSLDLSGNLLGSLPDSLWALKELQTLKLQGNQLETLPNSSGALANLRSLDLACNALKALPNAVLQMPALQELCLDGNVLTQLPSKLPAKCPQLRALGLKAVGLTTLPADIGSLKALTSLDLSQNKVEALPEELATLPLQHVDLRGNPLTEAIPIPAALDSVLSSYGPLKYRQALEQLQLWLAGKWRPPVLPPLSARGSPVTAGTETGAGMASAL
uniref:Uncharacterized protein n=1 Tax=Eutreptiella gymnastica TaxID=73025 RepID=A0A7S1I385_9EUGL